MLVLSYILFCVCVHDYDLKDCSNHQQIRNKSKKMDSMSR